MKKASIITVGGSRREVGLQIGKTLKEYIIKYTNRACERLTPSRDAWLRASWKITKNYFPGAAEELRGMAEGAEVPVLALFCAFCEEISEISKGCTDIVAMPDATKNKHTLIGHTDDVPHSSFDPFIIESTAQDGHKSIGITLGGTGYSVGFNSSGISFTGNHLTENDIKVGVPRLIIFGEMLRAKTFDRAVDIANHPNRASGYNYIIASSDAVADLEVSGEQSSIKYIDDGVHAHTNHFLDHGLKKTVEAKPKSEMKDSKLRLLRAQQLLFKNFGAHNSKSFRNILSDHKNGVYSICNHEEDLNGETIFSVIVNLEKRRILYSSGRPCCNEWSQLTF